MRTRNVSIITIALTICAGLCIAQAPAHEIAALPANQGTAAPLRIIAIHGTIENLTESVTLTNTSKKVVKSFRLAWNARNTVPVEVGVDSGDQSFGIGHSQLVTQTINPGDSTPTSSSLQMSVSDVNKQLLSKEAPKKILVLIGVEKVTFSDGTTWEASARDLAEISLPPSGTTACSRNKARLAPASLTLTSTASMAAAPQCGLCWRNGGIFKCLPQQNFDCDLVSPTSCTSHQNPGCDIFP